MKLSGEEQKLQALFSELSATDEQAAPRFATIWNRAQLAPRRTRAFNLTFVGATALLFCALVSLAVWARYSQRAPQPPVAKSTSTPDSTTIATVTPATTTPEPKPILNRPKPRVTRVASRQTRSTTRQNSELAAANRKLTQDAKTISNWQSPTSALLTSSGSELFNSLPQLNDSATQLKSFLPNSPN